MVLSASDFACSSGHALTCLVLFVQDPKVSEKWIKELERDASLDVDERNKNLLQRVVASSLFLLQFLDFMLGTACSCFAHNYADVFNGAKTSHYVL